MAFRICFTLTKSILDFTDQEVSPPVQHVSLEGRVMAELLGLHIFKFIGNLENCFVDSNVALVLELMDVLCYENSCHFAHVIVRAPVFSMQFILFIIDIVFGATNHSEVGISSFAETNGDAELYEFIVVIRVLHLFDNNALLHLADVLFLDHSHQVVEGAINELGTVVVSLLHTHCHEFFTTLLGQH